MSVTSPPDDHKPGVALFSTCSASAGLEPSAFRRRIVDIAHWSERHGCRGVLVYTDNSLVDPWVVAQTIVASTDALVPLIAVQPVYMHPYTVAKMITSIAHVHGRGIDLNMVAGGFVNDLRGLNDPTPHDRRYDRLREYTEIVARLLRGGPVTFEGEFYRIDRVRLSPALPPSLFPWIFVSGSSAPGLAAATALGAIAVQYPTPPGPDGPEPVPEGTARGIRVGIIARGDDDEAWRVAHARFPEDREGQLAHELAMQTSDSLWHRQLSGADADAPYWLAPFRNYKTFCPYLVGAYERIGVELARWIAAGYRTFILDIPPDDEEFYHTRLAFERAVTEVI